MTARPRPRVAPVEYLAREQAATDKHILWDGEIFAMAGALPEHNAIVANALAELNALTRRGPCRVAWLADSAW